MKKRTKKKLSKNLWIVVSSLLKVIVILLKGIWWVLKYIYGLFEREFKGLRREREDKKVREKRKKAKSVLKFKGFKELKKDKGKLSSFDELLYNGSSTIGIILGARGKGKSALGMRLLENFTTKSDKHVYAMGFKQETLPKWIKVVNSVGEISNDSVILIDEGGIEFSSRKAMSSANNILSELLLISRHKDLSVIFITQNSSNLEINAIRQADYLLLKPSSLLQKDFERPKIRKIYSSLDFSLFEKDKGVGYIFSDKYRGYVSNRLPSFWTSRVSKGYAGKK